MSSRQPFHGLYRKLVIAFDVGTTYSGVSYSLLDPGLVPEIKGVTRYPAQERVGGDSKIPSIIYYDPLGRARAFGAEALQESIVEKAEDEGWIKAEWFKLHLRPRGLSASHITDLDIPPLPKGKTAVDVFADFLEYLFDCARTYIQETHPEGVNLWISVENHIEYILSLPNGWEGAQQQGMRRAAVKAGLIPDTVEDHARLQFVTEGEASLHFCIQKGLATDAVTNGEGIIIVDAGGGTVDLSAYCRTTSPDSFEEVAPSQCRLQGSVFVSRRARAYLEDKLQGSRYGNIDDVNHITNCFDKTTKLSFRNSEEPSFIKFGTARDKDPRFDIRSGQMKLPGSEVAGLFKPSVQDIIDAIELQRKEASKPISTVFLVGGFAASGWLFSQLQEHLKPLGLSFSRPDSHVNKAVADGAVSFYLDHFVSVRVAKHTYGVACSVDFDPSDPQHLFRSHTVYTRPSGILALSSGYDPILTKGIRISEDKEFKNAYFQEYTTQAAAGHIMEQDIICYKGRLPDPRWMDAEPNMFSTLCTVVADISQVAKTLKPRRNQSGEKYFVQEFNVVLLFGLTELKALVSWMENGVEKRSPATIVYDQDIQATR